MKKRIFRLLPVLLVILLFAMTVLAACNSHSEVYYLSKGSDFTAYDDEEAVPNGVRFTKGDNDIYTYVADFEQGEQFVVYNCGEEGSILKELFSSEQHLTLADGKVTVVDAGHYALSLDVGKGELSYTYTPPTPTKLTVKSVAITTKVGTLKVGENSTFVATVTMSDNSTNSNVTWASSNTSVATVNASGKVEALTTGTATITATAGEISDSVQLTVTAADVTPVAVTALTLSGDDLDGGEIYLFAGDDPVTVNVAITPANATNKAYSYAVEGNEDGIVTVSAVTGGYSITPVKPGEVTLTVTSDENPQIKDQCTITVDPVAVTDLQVSPATVGVESKFYVGGEQDVLVTVLPTNATDKTYSYQLSKEGIVEVAVIDGGYKVTALDVGTVTLTVTSSANGDASATCQITVSELEVLSIEMEETLTIEKGETKQLHPVLKPDGVDDEISYSIGAGEDSIVSVDTDGTVHALAEGIAHVTAHATNGVTAECTVIVPKHVTGITLSSALTVYVGDGAKPHDLAVKFIPSDATFTDFTVDVQQEGEIIEWVKGDGKITVTGKSEGTATITVTSVDNDEVSKSCTVTVKDITQAVPYFSPSSVVVLLGDTSAEVEILSDYGEITAVTHNPNTVAQINDVETDDGSFKFTVTGLKFGKATITFNVTIGETQHQLYFGARIVSDYFYLTGVIGGNEAWVEQGSEAAAREANLLLEQKDADTWEITRDFKAGDKIQILPSILGEEWANAITNSSYQAASGEAANGITTQDVNVMFSHDGNYTVRLLLSLNAYMTARWQVITNYIAPTSATISGDVNQLEQNDDVTTANLTLKITPTLAVDKIEADDIVWTVDQSYASWLTLTKGENGRTCAVELVDFQGDETVHATITATITKGNFVVTATFELALLPEGAGVVYVDSVTFDQDSYELLVDSDGWTITVHAEVNGNATTQGVTYSIVSGQSELYNGIADNHSFTIDSATGKITAKQFGTIKVRATSIGEAEGGRSVTKDVEVKIYSKTLKLAGVYGDKKNSDWNQNTTAYTSATSDTEYVWKDLTLYKQDQIVVVYNVSDWDNGVIRNYNTYRATDSTSGVVASSGSDIDHWCFLIQKDGVYTITVKLSGTKPTVKFEKTADLEVSETWSTKITDVAIVSTGNTWKTATEYFVRKQNQTVTNENPYVELVLDCASISTLNTTNPQIGMVVGSTWYDSNSAAPKFTNSSAYVSSAWTTGKWQQYNGQLQYVGNPYTSKVKLNFKFQFDSHGTLVDIQVSAAE